MQKWAHPSAMCFRRRATARCNAAQPWHHGGRPAKDPLMDLPITRATAHRAGLLITATDMGLDQALQAASSQAWLRVGP